MNRILAGTLLTFALLGSAGAANAATATPSAKPAAKTQIASAQVNFAAECKALGEQWASASVANASHLHFAQAKADATRAERNCKSTNIAMHKKAAGQYETALKLLDISPIL